MYHNIYREPGAHVASLALRLVDSDGDELPTAYIGAD